MTLTEIKEAIGRVPRCKNGKLKGMPQDLRREILSHAKVDGIESVSGSIGISPGTVYGWTDVAKKPAQRKFRQISVIPEITEATFVVEGPSGLRFVGLTLPDAAKLIREVSREF